MGHDVLPDVGAGNVPLTSMWWIAAMALFFLTVIAGVAVALVNRWISNRDDNDRRQTSAIHAMQQRFNDCQIHCAEHRSLFVRREDFEGRMLRFEDMLVRIHERVDRVAEKLGVVDA